MVLVGSLTAPLLAACGNNAKVSEKAENHSEQIGEKSKNTQKLEEEKNESAEKREHPEKSEHDEKGEEKLLTLNDEETEKAGIKLLKLVLQQRNEQLVVTATIQANQDKLAHVGPRVTGRIVKVNANLARHARSQLASGGQAIRAPRRPTS